MNPSPLHASASQDDEDVARRRLQSIFDFFDEDKDGYVKASELGNVLRSLGGDPTDVEIAEIIASADANHDGKLAFDEFLELITREMEGGAGTEPREIVESFRIFDHNRDGRISATDFERVMTTMGQKFSKEEVGRMLAMCDVDGEGMINYEKFIDSVVAAPANVALLDL